MADDIIGSLGIQIEADASDFPGQFDAAVAQAQAAGQSIAQGFNSGAAGVDGLTESADGLAGALTALKAIGIGAAIEQLGSASLESSANMERATIALTALTGSATQANTEIAGLKQLAHDDALSFPEVLQANQRLTALGVSAAQIPAALRAAADGAAAMNNSLLVASNAMDRMVSTGSVAARSLTQLGLQMADVSKAMVTLGFTADDSVTKAGMAFKSLDESQRVEVMVQALSKLQGTAEAVAEGLSGAYNRMENAITFALAQIGDALAPAAKDLADFSIVALPAAAEAVNALTSSGVSIVEFGKAMADARKPLVDLVAEVVPFGDELKAVSASGQVTVTSLINFLTPLGDVKNAFDLATAAMQAFTNTGPQIDAMSKAMTANLQQMTTAAALGGKAFKDAWDLSALQSGFAIVGAGAKQAIAEQEKATEAFNTAKQAVADLTKAYEAQKPTLDGHIVTQADLQRAYADLDKAQKSLTAGNKDYQDTLGGLTEAYNKQQGTINTLEQTIGQLLAVTDRTQAQDTILAEATTKLTGLLKQQADAHGLVAAAAQGQGKAYDGLVKSADELMTKEIASGIAVSQAKAVLDQLTSSTDTSAEHTRAVSDAVQQYADAIKRSGGALTDQIAIEVNGVSVLTTVGDAINKAKDAQSGFTTTVINGVSVIRESGTAHAIAAAQVNQYAQSVRNANDNTSQAINYNSSLAASINHTRDATADELSVNNAWNDSISTSVDNASKFANSINGVTAALNNMATAEDAVGTAAFDAGKGLEGMNGQTANAMQYVAGVLALAKSPATGGMVSTSAVTAAEQALHKMGYAGDKDTGFTFSQQLYDAMNGIAEASTTAATAVNSHSTATNSLSAASTTASSSVGTLATSVRDLNSSTTQTSSSADGLTASFTTANTAVDFAGMTGAQLGAAIGRLGTELLSAGVVVDGAGLSAVDYATKLQGTVDGMNESAAAVQQMSKASTSAAVGIATAAAVIQAAGAMTAGVSITGPSQQMQDALTNMTALGTPGSKDLGNIAPNVLATFKGQTITGSPGMSLSQALSLQDYGVGSGSSSTGPMPLYTGAPQPDAQPINVTMNYPVFSNSSQSQQTMKDIVTQIRTVTGIKQ